MFQWDLRGLFSCLLDVDHTGAGVWFPGNVSAFSKVPLDLPVTEENAGVVEQDDDQGKIYTSGDIENGIGMCGSTRTTASKPFQPTEIIESVEKRYDFQC
jgi:hypothetical protein